MISPSTIDMRRPHIRLSLFQIGWWLVVILTITMFVLSLPVRYRELVMLAPAQPQVATWQAKFVVSVDAVQAPLQLDPVSANALQQLGLSRRFYAGYIIGFEILFVTVQILIGFLIFWRKPNDRLAIFAALVFVLNGLFFVPVLTALGRADPAWKSPVISMLVLSSSCALIFCFLFPDGRFVPRWTRLFTIGWIVWMALLMLFPLSLNPWNWPALRLIVYLLSTFGLISVAQIYRYSRISTLVQRQQTKWFVYGISTSMFSFVIFNFDLPGILFPVLRQPGLARGLYNLAILPVYMLMALLPPLSITVAILRYRLWEIDVIIRRTLVYSVLTTLLVLIYLGSVLLLESLRISLTARRSEIETVLATLLITALFTPLQQRVQRGIDRRFYRHKYDAEKVLATFALTMRDEVDLDRLSSALVKVAEETMQPAQVLLWLKQAAQVTQPAAVTANQPKE